MECISECVRDSIYLEIVNKLLRNCHSWLA